MQMVKDFKNVFASNISEEQPDARFEFGPSQTTTGKDVAVVHILSASFSGPGGTDGRYVLRNTTLLCSPAHPDSAEQLALGNAGSATSMELSVVPAQPLRLASGRTLHGSGKPAPAPVMSVQVKSPVGPSGNKTQHAAWVMPTIAGVLHRMCLSALALHPCLLCFAAQECSIDS
jgi:hypothetical protein